MVELISYICLCTFNLYIYSFLCKTFSPIGTVSSVTFYEGSSKSFRTFIFSRETVRAGGVVIGRV